METVEITTPSGHKVYLRPYLTYTDKRELRKIFGQYMTFDMKTKQENNQLNGRAKLEAEEYAVKAMVQRVVEVSGKEYTGVDAYNAIMAWQDEKDGDAIFAKMDELTTGKALPPENSDAKKN